MSKHSFIVTVTTKEDLKAKDAAKLVRDRLSGSLEVKKVTVTPVGEK